MSQKPDKERHIESPFPQEDIALRNKIESCFSSGNIKEGLTLCAEHGIDSAQFSLYINPENDKPCTLEDKLTIEKSDQTAIQEIDFSSTFPYTFKELMTLKAFNNMTNRASLSSMIDGALNSYGSIEIMRVFNNAEYLALLASTRHLKQNIPYLKLAQQNIITGKNSISEIFGEFINYLNYISYGEKFWAKQTSSFSKKYQTTPGAEKERIAHIPEQEKQTFINSIFHRSDDTISRRTIQGNPDFSPLLVLNSRGQYIKGNYVLFLLEQLNKKWNNQDKIPPSYL